ICGSPTGWDQVELIREQQAVLRRIEEVDAVCREHHISAAAARQVLGKLDIPCSFEVIDGWEFLRGSDDPRPLSPVATRSQPGQGRSILVPLVLACIAAWLPYSRALIAPVVVFDDYEILA